jgi:hypothetical protein
MPAFLVSWTEHHQVTAVIVAPTPELARRQVETESVPAASRVGNMDAFTLKVEPMTDQELRRRLASR